MSPVVLERPEADLRVGDGEPLNCQLPPEVHRTEPCTIEAVGVLRCACGQHRDAGKRICELLASSIEKVVTTELGRAALRATGTRCSACGRRIYECWSVVRF